MSNQRKMAVLNSDIVWEETTSNVNHLHALLMYLGACLLPAFLGMVANLRLMQKAATFSGI